MEGIKIRCQCAFSFYVVFGEGCHLVRCPKCHEYIDKDGHRFGKFPNAHTDHARPQDDDWYDDDTDEGFVLTTAEAARAEEEAKDERYERECELHGEARRQKLMKQGYL